MKKLLITLLLINIFTPNINAETYEENYSISLSYSVEPTYSVKIPKKIDVSNNNTVFEYYVCGDIYADQILQVKFDEQTTISNSKQTINVYITQEKSNFVMSELSNNYNKYTALITHNDLSTGNWSGQLNVVISLIGGI